jgi:hypothetical protein
MSNTKKFKFSGHQTFTFRYGWLEKGVRAVAECPTAFSEEDALVRLGVGKNMVESIRHWCTQMLEEDPEVKRNNGRLLLVSAIGRRLLEDGAWDPFLEDDASPWLIHWLLVSNPRIGTTWEIAFSSFQRPDFAEKRSLEVFFRMVKQLPKFAWRTSRLPSTTLPTREAFEKAKFLERFLYVDLPAALELPGFSDSQTDASQIETFFNTLSSNLHEWSRVLPKIIDQAKETLLKACTLEPTEKGWEQLRGSTGVTAAC